MSYKFTFLLGSFAFLLLTGVYFVLNPSYEKSFEAKYYYYTGDYEKALFLAKEAFALNVYNRMASTIMAQSQIAMQYERYIKEAKGYIKEINAIAHQEKLSEGDKAKIKLMSEIVIDGYIKLAPSVVTDKKLVEEAAHYHEQFVKLHEKITSAI